MIDPRAIIEALAAVGVGAVSAWFLYRGKVKVAELEHKVGEREATLRYHAGHLSIVDQFTRDARIMGEIEALAGGSPIDRVLLLTAVNGKFDPHTVTAVWQYRIGLQEQISYIDTRIDDFYRTRLKLSETSGPQKVVVADLPLEDMMRGVYLGEAVKQSIWCFAGAAEDQKTGCREVTFLSFSTHSADDLDEGIMARCQVIADMFCDHRNRGKNS